MNFTKQYIKECDCKEIQGLKEDFGDYDFVVVAGDVSNVAVYWEYPTMKYDEYVWLPTGDDLDYEIEKICKENDLEYSLSFNVSLGWLVETQDITTSDETEFDVRLMEDNPLIAKIELLKALLRG